MTTALKPVPKRLKELPEIHLASGGHYSFDQGVCAMELVSYLAGEKHSAHPACSSPVLTSFLIRLNDGLPDDARQKLKPYLPKVIGTRDDQDEARAWLAADWAIRVALPTWLELNGTSEAATGLRALAPITGEKQLNEIRPRLREIRDEAWERRRGAMSNLRSKVREEVKKKLAKFDPPPKAAAAAVAEAAAAAVAVAVAVAAAEAEAEAAAAAVANFSYGTPAYRKVREAARKVAKEAVKPVIEEKIKPTSESLLDSALLTLEKMIDPKAAE